MQQETVNWEMIWQNLRYLLIALGGWLSGRGYVSTETWAQVVGLIAVVGPIAWGWYVKYGTRAVPKDVAERPSVPTVSGATGTIQK